MERQHRLAPLDQPGYFAGLYLSLPGERTLFIHVTTGPDPPRRRPQRLTVSTAPARTAPSWHWAILNCWRSATASPRKVSASTLCGRPSRRQDNGRKEHTPRTCKAQAIAQRVPGGRFTSRSIHDSSWAGSRAPCLNCGSCDFSLALTSPPRFRYHYCMRASLLRKA